jgi:hypothetical protein
MTILWQGFELHLKVRPPEPMVQHSAAYDRNRVAPLQIACSERTKFCTLDAMKSFLVVFRLD